jgi:hypothetical protein
MKATRAIHALLLAAAVVAGPMLFVTVEGSSRGGSPAQVGSVQAAGLRLAIDADATNGTCTTIDSATTVIVGQSYQVAVCVENLPQEVDAIDLDIYYDDTLHHVPDLPNEVPALDDNPDANAGETTFSSPDLGSGWDCSGFGRYFPVGDQNPASGPGKGDAFITCDHFTGGTHYLAGKSLPLAVIEVEALNAGVDSFVFGDLVRLVWEGRTFGLCDPESPWSMPCDGATITILPAPTATATPTPKPSVTPTPSPTLTPSPTATPEPVLDTDGGGAPDYLEVAVGGDPLNGADDAAILALDSDGDGCANGEELAGAAVPAPGSTGAYDFLAYYDFFDVPVPANPDPAANGPKDGAVAMDDVLAVLFYVGTFDGDGGVKNPNGVAYDSDKDSDKVKDGRGYDRSPGSPPNPPWDVGPPNGAISMDDVLAVLAQMGLDCGGPP